MQTVGFWNANGNLVTKNVNNILINPFANKWFDSFNKPNKNYNPNWYKKYYNYYESPNPYRCMSYQNNTPSYNWLSPPHTYKRLLNHRFV